MHACRGGLYHPREGAPISYNYVRCNGVIGACVSKRFAREVLRAFFVGAVPRLARVRVSSC